MKHVVQRHVPWSVATLSVVVLGLAAAAGWTTDPGLHVQRLAVSDIGWWVAYGVFSVVGAVVATRRSDNAVGWLMLLAGAVNASGQGSKQFAERLRDELDVDAVTVELAGAIEAAVAPASVTIWWAPA